LNFTGLPGVTFQNKELFVTIAVRSSESTFLNINKQTAKEQYKEAHCGGNMENWFRTQPQSEPSLSTSWRASHRLRTHKTNPWFQKLKPNKNIVRLFGIRRWHDSGWRCIALFLITLKMNFDSIAYWQCREFGIKFSLKLSTFFFSIY
jgi:hypothetical protein